MDPAHDPFDGDGPTRLEFKNSIQLLRPRDFVCRHPPGKATGQTKVLSFREECLAAFQIPLLLAKSLLNKPAFGDFPRQSSVRRGKLVGSLCDALVKFAGEAFLFAKQPRFLKGDRRLV